MNEIKDKWKDIIESVSKQKSKRYKEKLKKITERSFEKMCGIPKTHSATQQSFCKFY